MGPFVMDDGRIGHVEVAIGNPPTSQWMISDEYPELGIAVPDKDRGAAVTLRLQVPDVGATGLRRWCPTNTYHGRPETTEIRRPSSTRYHRAMIISTTPSIEGRPVREYLGLVSGETIIGANILRDFMAGIRDIVGGRSSLYEQSLREAKDNAIAEMTQAGRALGAEAILGVDLDYESISTGQGGGMLMVTASGTAVRF